MDQQRHGIDSRRLHGTEVDVLLGGGSLGPDPFLERALEPVRGAWLVLEVGVTSARRLTGHRGWAGDAGGTLLLDLGDGQYDLFRELPGLFPAAVARLLRLGPRKLCERSGTAVPEDVARGVWAEDDRARTRAFERLGGLDERWCWSAAAHWPAEGGAVAGRQMAGMTGPEGWWRLVAGTDDLALEPTTPTELWASVIDLFPTDDEIGPLG